MANSIGFGREWDYMVLKLPNNELPFEKRFENIRNCRVLKHRKRAAEKCKITGHSNRPWHRSRFRRERNYRVLKLEKIFRVLHRGFGRREITWCSNRISSMCRWISSLEGWITWYSNAQKYTGNNEFGLEEGKITWYSNEQERLSPQNGSLEEDEITWYSNILWNRLTSDFSVGFGRR